MVCTPGKAAILYRNRSPDLEQPYLLTGTAITQIKKYKTMWQTLFTHTHIHAHNIQTHYIHTHIHRHYKHQLTANHIHKYAHTFNTNMQLFLSSFSFCSRGSCRGSRRAFADGDGGARTYTQLQQKFSSQGKLRQVQGKPILKIYVPKVKFCIGILLLGGGCIFLTSNGWRGQKSICVLQASGRWQS